MDSKRFQRIDQIINEALKLPREQWSASVKAACAGEEDLAAEVMDMLGMGDEAGRQGFLETPLLSMNSEPLSENEQVGPYRIVSLLGEGGMGRVYLAHQTEPFERQVALKLIKRGIDSQSLLDRFHIEQKTLAAMSHPYIAQVYDAGVSDGGQPYFVMEYIEGVPLTRYCDEQKLDLRRRLDIFARFCEAIHYAHQRGTIHRDLKPANLLVTVKEGIAVPKVIDFGIALTGRDTPYQPKPEDLSATVAGKLTQTGLIMGSLEFMSPEQTGLVGRDVDIRTDIYSMGVVLYELLTGRRPLDETLSGEMDAAQALKLIREQAPPPPSARVTRGEKFQQHARDRFTTPANLRHHLRGDLGCITMKAIARDKEDRYSSAAELHGDLQRYLRNEPITARKATWFYVLSKLVGRHKLFFSAATLALLALIVGSVLVTAGLIRERRAREEAQAQTRRAHQTLGIFQEFMSSANPDNQGRHITLLEMLERFPDTLPEDTDPEVQGHFYQTMGTTYESLGYYDGALENYQNAYEQRLAALGEEHQDTLISRRHLANMYTLRSRYAEAEEVYRDIWARQEALLGPTHPDTLNTKEKLAVLLGRMHQRDEAVAILKEVLARRRAVSGGQSREVMKTLSHLGVQYNRMGRFREAEQTYREALELGERIMGLLRPDTLSIRNNLVLNFYKCKKYDEALPLAEELLKDRMNVLGEGHPQTIKTYNLIGSILIKQKAYARAEPIFREGLAKSRETLGPTERDTLAFAQNLAIVLNYLGRTKECATLFEEVLADKTTAFGPDFPDTLNTKANLAFIYMGSGREKDGLKMLREVNETAARVLKRNDRNRLVYLANLTMFLTRQGHFAEAEPLAREYLELESSIELPSKSSILMVKRFHARSLAGLGRLEEALTKFQAIQAQHEKEYAKDHDELREYVSWYAHALEQAGRAEQATALRARFNPDEAGE